MADTILPPDLDQEEPAPATVLAEAVSPPAPPSAEIPFDADPDIPTEQETTEAAAGVFGPDHWTAANVESSDAMTKELPAGYKPPAFLILPSVGQAGLDLISEALLPVADRLGADAASWAELLSKGDAFLTVNDQFAAALADQKRCWKQTISLDGVKMMASVPASNKVPPGTVLSGSDALIQMSRTLGTYARMQFPLPHSGLWLNVAVPMGDELHWLEARLASAKYSLGWLSKGLVYSNTMVMQNIELINFVLERTVAANCEDASVQGLKRVMRITDINLLAANLAMAIYPSGFPLERPCTADPLKCHATVKGVLRLSKLIWTDDNAFSDWQRKHMQTRLSGRKKTAEDMQRYQEEFVGVAGPRLVELKPGLSVRLLPPTIEQYEESGYEWVASIERGANQMLGTLSEKELDDYMMDQYRMTTMRQYAHWVDAIVYPDEVLVTGREDINQSLKTASTETEVADRFIEAVKAYIDDCTVSLVAINNYSCPSCGKSQTEEATRHPGLIPIDPIHTFFTLSDLKTRTTLLKNMDH